MRDIFLSYRRGDSPGFAGRLFDRVEDRFGEGSVFMDVDGIDPGLDFVEVLNDHLGSCKALVAIIGPEWLSATDARGRRRLDDPNDFVRLEIATALTRNIRVIPVLVDGAASPATEDLPDDLQPLARRQAVTITHERFGQDIQPLMAAIERAVGRIAAAPPAAAPVPTPAPAIAQAHSQAYAQGPTQGFVAPKAGQGVAAVLERFRGLENLFFPPLDPKRVANARRKAHIPPDAEIVALMDFTVFGNANDSMAFTEQGVFYHHSLNTSGQELLHLPLAALRAASIGRRGSQKVVIGHAELHIDGGAKPDRVAGLFEVLKAEA